MPRDAKRRAEVVDAVLEYMQSVSPSVMPSAHDVCEYAAEIIAYIDTGKIKED